MRFQRLFRLMLAGLMTAGTGNAAAVTEIHWWHAMGGALGERVEDIIGRFNASQSEYRLLGVYKGTYSETMTTGIAAFRAGKQPHILQVFEVGTATMMGARGAIKPVHELTSESRSPFDASTYLGPVAGYYASADGKMLSMPFNSSTPILFYNKDAFRKAGLDPERPPETWPQVEEYARRLLAAGYGCGFTTGWPAWVQLENLSAWHNVPFGTRENGFAGNDTEFVFNGDLQTRHIQRLDEWQKEKIFVYGGRRNQATAKFTSGECPMLTDSSSGHAGFEKGAGFEFGSGNLPYWPDVEGAPRNTIIGGSSLWVMGGHRPDEYQGVARFFDFLSRTEIQVFWHKSTGYVPITRRAYELLEAKGFYKENPGRDIPVLQMIGKAPTVNSRGMRFGSFVQIRGVIEEELEAVWSGTKSPRQGLDDAVRRGNRLLRRFERLYR